MKFKYLTLNLFAPIWWALAIYAAVNGHISWWAVLLIALSMLKLEYTFGRK